ncbi:AP-4 complex subunit sigma-1 [Chamberlinius hualienensis]
MINFLFMVNETGRTIFSSYYNDDYSSNKVTLEHEVSRRCLVRSNEECRFYDYQGMRIIYRHYGSVLVIASASDDENELAVFEFINLFMRTLDTYFQKVTESKVSFQTYKQEAINS